MNDLHAPIREKLRFFYQENKIPHIVFHGSAGSGKKTLVHFFLSLIYGNSREQLKENVMYVNCAQGKGIKFIREELKSFAKINIQYRKEQPFKSIVLLNADYLTTEGQSALRRCIESFSKNTRFFIVVENKNKLLNPILSRFCDIYVPEFCVDGHTSIYQYLIHQNSPAKEETQKKHNCIREFAHLWKSQEPANWVVFADIIVEYGLSALDWMNYLRENEENEFVRTQMLMNFYIVRLEYRNESMLIFVLLEYYHRLPRTNNN